MPALCGDPGAGATDRPSEGPPEVGFGAKQCLNQYHKSPAGNGVVVVAEALSVGVGSRGRTRMHGII